MRTFGEEQQAKMERLSVGQTEEDSGVDIVAEEADGVVGHNVIRYHCF